MPRSGRVPPFGFGSARASISQRIVEERPQRTGILILRQIRPTLAACLEAALLERHERALNGSVPPEPNRFGRPVTVFHRSLIRVLFASVHQDVDRSSGSALATKKAGGAGIMLTPTASDRGECSPNLTESRSSVPWKERVRCVWCPRNLGVPGTWVGTPSIISWEEELTISMQALARLGKSRRLW